MERITLEEINISKLVEYKNNAKKHDKDQINDIRDSIIEFGYNDLIAIDENNEIIEGHGRLLALKEINKNDEKIKVIRLSGMSEEQKKKYRIIHNKLTLNTEIDLDILKKEFEEFKEKGFELDLTGFSQEEIKLLDLDEDIRVADRSRVIMIDPPEAPKLKERLAVSFKSFEDYLKVKEYLQDNGANKLLDLVK
jgi:ParB-like chromosome segregation protein Spo0J